MLNQEGDLRGERGFREKKVKSKVGQLAFVKILITHKFCFKERSVQRHRGSVKGMIDQCRLRVDNGFHYYY